MCVCCGKQISHCPDADDRRRYHRGRDCRRRIELKQDRLSSRRRQDGRVPENELELMGVTLNMDICLCVVKQTVTCLRPMYVCVSIKNKNKTSENTLFRNI